MALLAYEETISLSLRMTFVHPALVRNLETQTRLESFLLGSQQR
jgi:hypothetical protein